MRVLKVLQLQFEHTVNQICFFFVIPGPLTVVDNLSTHREMRVRVCSYS